MKRILIYMAMFSLVLFNCSKKTTTNNYYSSTDAGGSIVGIVYPAGSQAKVTAYLGIPITSTQIDTKGYYKLSGLPLGNYSLLVEAEGYNVYLTKANVQVTNKATVLMDTIFLVSIHDLILAVYPYNGSNKVGIDQPIRISFRKPMNKESVEKAFHIQPEVEGVFEWYEWSSPYGDGSGELHFLPRNKFLVNTLYQVTIDTTASDTAGIKLSKPYQFSFTTESVRVLYTYPGHNNTWVIPRTDITIYFNTDMDVESVNSAFQMVDSQHQNMTGNFYWENRREMRFYPDSTLLVNKTYTVTIDTIASDVNGAKLPKPYQFSFTTQPVLISYTYPNHKETWVDTLTRVQIIFNTDMDMESVDSAFQMVDSKLKVIAGKFSWFYQWQLAFDPDSSLSTNETYTVTIDSTAEDMHGNKLYKPHSFWFKTRSY